MTRNFRFAHEVAVQLATDGDPAALGGAVTVELCGHWEHEPPCLFPHHTESVGRADGYLVHVDFDCAPGEEADVRRRIDAALATGSLTGPDGSVTTWTVAG